MSTLQQTDRIQSVDYNPHWPEAFKTLANRVQGCITWLGVHVEHVGSTAVPRLPAKPIIDLDVVVASARDIPLSTARLATLGYVHEGDLGIEGREAFRWPAGEARHHLYLLVDGARELRRHVIFRDALRADAKLRSECAALKRSLANRYRSNREAYSAGKDEVVNAVLKRCGA